MARSLQQHCSLCGKFTVEVCRYDLVDHEDVGRYQENGQGHHCSAMDDPGGYGREPEPAELEPVGRAKVGSALAKAEQVRRLSTTRAT